MRRIHLHGRLADEFAPKFDMNVGSIAETARALEANFPGRFYRAIRRGAYHIVRGESPEDGESLDDTMLDFRYRDGDFHIVPAVAGSGGNAKGIITIVLGVALIATGIGSAVVAAAQITSIAGAATVAEVAASAAFAGLSVGQVGLLGATLVATGVASLLTPTPSPPKLRSFDAETKSSFFFNGPINVGVQGGPVAVVYGRMKVGSTVISSSLSAEQI